MHQYETLEVSCGILHEMFIDPANKSVVMDLLDELRRNFRVGNRGRHRLPLLHREGARRRRVVPSRLADLLARCYQSTALPRPRNQTTTRSAPARSGPQVKPMTDTRTDTVQSSPTGPCDSPLIDLYSYSRSSTCPGGSTC